MKLSDHSFKKAFFPINYLYYHGLVICECVNLISFLNFMIVEEHLIRLNIWVKEILNFLPILWASDINNLIVQDLWNLLKLFLHSYWSLYLHSKLSSYIPLHICYTLCLLFQILHQNHYHESLTDISEALFAFRSSS